MDAKDIYSIYGPPIALLVGLTFLKVAKPRKAAVQEPIGLWPVVLLIAIVGGIVLGLMAMFAGDLSKHATWFAMPILIAGVGAAAWASIREGLATREGLARLVMKASVVWIWLWFTVGPNPDTTASIPLLLLGLVGAWALWLWKGHHNATLAAGLALAVMGMAMLDAAFVRGPDVDDVKQYAEEFREELGRLLRWEEFGYLTTWLRQRDVSLDLEVPARVARRIATHRPHPTTLVGALDARILEPATIEAAHGREDYSIKKMQKDPLKRLDPEVVRLRIAVEDLSVDDKRVLASRLDTLWPSEDDNYLEDMYDLVLLYEQLGTSELLARRTPDIHRALIDCFVKPRQRFRSIPRGAKGFSNDRHDDSCDDEACWRALDLMSRYGVPDGIDLLTFEKYLQSQSGMVLWAPLNKMYRFHRMERATLLRLQLEWDHTRPSWHRLRRHHAAIGLLCLAFISALVLLRARKAPLAPEPTSQTVLPEDKDPKGNGPSPESFQSSSRSARAGSWFRRSTRAARDRDEPTDPS